MRTILTALILGGLLILTAGADRADAQTYRGYATPGWTATPGNYGYATPYRSGYATGYTPQRYVQPGGMWAGRTVRYATPRVSRSGMFRGRQFGNRGLLPSPGRLRRYAGGRRLGQGRPWLPR